MVVFPTLTVAAFQVSHLSHLGIPKLKTAALLLPLLLTVALHPAHNVDVLPTLIVAAFQISPFSH